MSDAAKAPAPLNASAIKARMATFAGLFQPFDWHHLLVCTPGMAACLIYGLVTRDTITAAIAAGSAFSVGFGLRRYRQFRSMAGAVALMTAAALIGSFAGGNFAVFLLVAAAASAGCACLALIDDDIWWVALQATIALFLASHYNATPTAAVMRAGIVCAAGLIQMMLVIGLDRLIPRPMPKPALNMPVPPTKRAMITYGSVSALSVGLAIIAAYGLHLDKAYWAPMTALIVLKPKFKLTQQRGTERFFGTIAGCAAATLITYALPPMAWIDSLLCVAGASCAYALLKARYAAFSLAVSFTAVMLLYTAHVSAVYGSEQRIYATILGGLISITVMWAASKTVARDFAI